MAGASHYERVAVMTRGNQTAQQKTFEIDMIVKVTLTTPAGVSEEDALDSIYCLVAVPGKKRFNVASEIVDADVVGVKE